METATTNDDERGDRAGGPLPEVAEETLRDVVERLAPLERGAGAPGEEEAARWIAERLRLAGARDVAVEEAPTWGPFAPTLVGLGAVQALAATLTLAGRRRLGAVLAAASAAGVVDEAQNGPRVLRRAVRRRRRTVNVVARAGDPGGARTLVVLAHHDAAQTGRMFDQRIQRALYERFPERMDRVKTPFPQWWIGLAAPVLLAAAALTRRRAPALAALTSSLLATVLADDIRRSPVVPGANDNLSAVAALVALAELLRDRPLAGLRVLLVSAGAEETLQDGIRAFVSRHRHELPAGSTYVLNLDTIGSGSLVMAEAEGPIWMEYYAHPFFRDLIARVAGEQGIALERGVRTRASTDAVITSRAGYPTASLLSLNAWRAPANYHLMTDVPENLAYDCVADATRLTYGVAAALAAMAA